MTHNELLLYLYSDFTLMHNVWRSMAKRHGVGAFVFFPEDYESATVLEEVHYRFWKAQDVSRYLEEAEAPESMDLAGELDLIRYLHTEGYVALVVDGDKEHGMPGVKVHKVTRMNLN